MKKKNVLIFILQLVLLFSFCIGLFYYLKAENHPKTVYMFKQNIAANTLITSDDVYATTLPASAVSNSFALKDIVNKYTNTQVYSNTIVYTQQLTTKDNIDPFAKMDMTKYRKVSIPISFTNGIAGDLKKGDKIDVVYTATTHDSSNNQIIASKTVLQNISVFSVNTDSGNTYSKSSTSSTSSGTKIDTTDSSAKLSTVTLLVTLDQDEQIATYLKAGSISLAGRLSGSKNYSTLGFSVIIK